MYKFIRFRTKCLIFVLDVIGFLTWNLVNVFRPWTFFRRNKLPLNPASILLIRVDYIGDVFLTTHTLKALRQRFPMASLTFLTSSKSKSVLENNPYIDEIITYDPPWFFKKKLINMVKEYILIWRKLKKNKFDLGVDYRGDLRNILLLLVLTAIPYRVSFGSSGGSYLLTQKVPFIPYLHEAEYHNTVARTLGAHPASSDIPQIHLTNDEIRQTDFFIDANHLQGIHPLVIIVPGARQKTRIWPAERYAAVGKYLINCFSAKIILAGSLDELSLLENLNRMLNRQAVITHPYISNIRQLAALMQKCDLYIGVSSGPSHLAGSARLNSVLLFGPERKSQWRPLGNRHIIIKHEFACSPCTQINCKNINANCINAISVDEVCNAAYYLLSSQN